MTGSAHSPELPLEVSTASDMHALGRRIGDRCRAGDLVVLTGPLGAGKTVVAQGIGAALGVTGLVTSPTFVIARLHRGGRVPFVHVDAYRLGSLAEVDDLDLDTELGESVTAVEWGAGMVEHLADAHLCVAIERGAANEVRTVQITPWGDRWTKADLRAISET